MSLTHHFSSVILGPVSVELHFSMLPIECVCHALFFLCFHGLDVEVPLCVCNFLDAIVMVSGFVSLFKKHLAPEPCIIIVIDGLPFCYCFFREPIQIIHLIDEVN